MNRTSADLSRTAELWQRLGGLFGADALERKNTRDNTPAVIHVQIVLGDTVDVRIAAKGGGSENKSKCRRLR